MPEPTIANVKPLLREHHVDGGRVECTFACSRTGLVRASASSLSHGAAGRIANNTKQQVRNSFFGALRNSFYRLASSVLGGGEAGRIAGSAAGEVIDASRRTTTGPTTFSAAEIEIGIVDAFKNVLGDFAWDGERWVGRSAFAGLQNAFDKRAAASPIIADFDREIAARILAAIAGSDGNVAAEEAAMIDELAPARLGGSQGALTAGLPSAIECEGVSAGDVRKTIIQTAWALAMVDGAVAADEVALVVKAGAALGLGEADVNALRADAKVWALDRAVASAGADGTIDAAERTRLVATATALGLGADDAERAIVRFRKAKGI